MNETSKQPVRSMTGFGAGTASRGTYTVELEIKAVNNRYRDINVRLPSTLRCLEPLLLEQFAPHSLRGKIDVYLQFKDTAATEKQLAVDQVLLQNYRQALQTIAHGLAMEEQQFSVQDLLGVAAYPGIIAAAETALDFTQLSAVLTEAAQAALADFLQMKEKEGAHLAADIRRRIAKIAAAAEALAQLAPRLTANYQQHLVEMLEQQLAEQNIDMARIVQEVALYSEKINYTEEVVRLRSHLQQFVQTLELGGNIGRKLDFIVQEMNREINTAAAKANSAQASQFAVEIKSELEKIREQIQNIE